MIYHLVGKGASSAVPMTGKELKREELVMVNRVYGEAWDKVF